jgi:hypothetical protein
MPWIRDPRRQLADLVDRIERAVVHRALMDKALLDNLEVSRVEFEPAEGPLGAHRVALGRSGIAGVSGVGRGVVLRRMNTALMQFRQQLDYAPPTMPPFGR